MKDKLLEVVVKQPQILTYETALRFHLAEGPTFVERQRKENLAVLEYAAQTLTNDQEFISRLIQHHINTLNYLVENLKLNGKTFGKQSLRKTGKPSLFYPPH